MTRYEVRITCDETFTIEADDEEEATTKAWDIIMTYGHWGSEVNEREDE